MLRLNDTSGITPSFDSEEEYLYFLNDKYNLKLMYSSFDGWKHMAHDGKFYSINKEGYRTTENINNHCNSEVWFLGGSTMWGFGNNDKTTIPSLFNNYSDSFCAYNYAEQGYNTRQVLARLINLYSIGKSCDLVITMDGFNDIISLCDENVPIAIHSKTSFYSTILKYSERTSVLTKGVSNLGKGLYQVFLAKTIEMCFKVHSIIIKESDTQRTSQCLKDRIRADKLVDQVIRNWEIMNHVVTQNGGKFIAILQPVASISKSRVDHLEDIMLPAELDPLNQLYPMLIKKINELDYDWIYDFTTVFDKERVEYIFMDNCHFGKNGNQILVDSLISNL